MSVVTVSEVVEAFSAAFKSVDLRIVAVKPEDHWVNVITSLFLSSRSQEEIESEQQQTRDKLPNTDKFRVFLASLHFNQLQILFESFKKGRIRVHNTLIKFTEFNPSALKVDQLSFYERAPSYLKEMKEWRLAGSQADTAKDDAIWRIIESQNGHARRHGYENIYDLIKETLGIRDFGRGRTRALAIGIPMPAQIVDVSLVGPSLKIKTNKAFDLTDLQLNLAVERLKPRTRYYETVWRKTELVKKCKRPSSRKFCYVTNSIKLPDLMPHDIIRVELIHRQAPTLGMDKRRLDVPLRNAVEPFAKSLFKFCSLDIFRECLLNPEQSKKPADDFEDAVAWLLALIGLSVAQLRRFEKLRIPATKYEVGSIDMIAYRENEWILLIDCDTKIPDEKKIRSMMAVKEHFRFIQDEYRRPYIVSAIFSPKDCTGISVDRQHVKIVDRHQIKHIFEEAMKGNLEEAISSLVY